MVTLQIQIPQWFIDKHRPRQAPINHYPSEIHIPISQFLDFGFEGAPDQPLEPPAIQPVLRYVAHRWYCSCDTNFWWWSVEGEDLKPRCWKCGIAKPAG